MAAYLTLDDFKVASVMRTEFIDEVVASQPGFIEKQLDFYTDHINSRLRKRYDVPFVAPIPSIIVSWLASLVTWPAYLKRGGDPTDKQWTEFRDAHTLARTEIKEAAESVDGLFDLPLRADLNQSALTAPKTRVYSETSPYAWTDAQQRDASNEDFNRNGGTSA